MLSPSQKRGLAGENIARRFLENLGYRFLVANWRCKVGEIDLIMKDHDTIVFVEVRLRRPTSYGQGYETVAWQKQQKLVRTAQVYQQRYNYWGNIRFDVISISDSPPKPLIDHIRHAF